MSAEQAARQSALEAYAAYVEQCYQGEVNGEVLFRAMVALSKDAHAQRKLRVLEQLERETKESCDRWSRERASAARVHAA